MTKPHQDFQLLFEGLCDNKILIKKFISNRTKVKVVFADIVGPLVKGFFCLATEASDDDGLPHTLEHVIFLGSEDYPYKGALDKVATRCLSEGTNAWTDKDHTCYTVTTAGSSGFLTLLPIYLDHILYPTLSESAYTTEVHHITEEAKDAGVVYSEMQSVENTGTNRVHMELLRKIYPLDCGYRFETGGVLENLRSSTTNEKVRNFHKTFYRPENLCLIVTGKMNQDEFFNILSKYEEKILSKAPLQPFKRPWMDPIAPLPSSEVRTIPYPSDDKDEGLITFGWRGPNINDQFNITACSILMEYLTDTPVALLNQTFVEIQDPYCGEIEYNIVENMESIIGLEFESVTMNKIQKIQPKLCALLQGLATGDLKFDMTQMNIVINKKMVELKSQLEDDPHDAIASTMIGEFLYGLHENDIKSRLNQIEILKKLVKEGDRFWKNIVEKYFVNSNSVTIIGEPSPVEVKKNIAEEQKRVDQRRADFGVLGLQMKKQILINAIEENNKIPPDDFLMTFPIPGVSQLNYHSIKSYSNNPHFVSLGADASFDDLRNIPCHFQLDDIQTDFVNINLCFDLKDLPSHLVPYLSLFAEVFFESPIVKDGVRVPYEVVVQHLNRDTVEYSSSIGLYGSRFQPGEFSNSIFISLKLELQKLEKGLEWCGNLLGGIVFTEDRISTVAKKLVNDIKQMQREADNVIEALTVANIFENDSVPFASMFITQQHFLKELQSSKKVKKHLPRFKEIQEYLMTLDKVYIQMSANVSSLKSHLQGSSLSALWKKHFISLLKSSTKRTNPAESMQWNLKKDDSVVKDPSKVTSCIVGLGSTDSTYMTRVGKGIDAFNHPDMAALLVFCHYISFLEGPMWNLIRGKGLAYAFSLTPDFNEGLLYFQIEKSSSPFEAYEQAVRLFKNIISGETKISQMELECAKCQCTYELIQAVQTPSMTSMQALSCFLRNISLDYYNKMLENIQKVTVEELSGIASKYISPLIDPKMSSMFIVCTAKDMSLLLNNFQTLNHHKFQAYKTVSAIQVKK